MLQVTGLQVASSKKNDNNKPATSRAEGSTRNLQPATCNTKSNLLLFVKKVVTCRTIT